MSGLLALPPALTAILLLLFRIAAGAGWIQHGLYKARGGTWRQVGKWIGSMGPPAFMAPLVTILEIVGGLFLVLGLLTPVVGLLFALEMAGLVVMKKTKVKSVFLPSKQDQSSYEVEYLYMVIAIPLIAVGAGSLSLDAALGLF